MYIIALVVMFAGVAGAALTYLGMLNVLPLMYWGGIAAVGGLAVIFTRRASD